MIANYELLFLCHHKQLNFLDALQLAGLSCWQACEGPAPDP